MKETEGWKLLNSSLNQALQAIDKQKAKIARSTWSQDQDDPKAQVKTRVRTFDEIGTEYVLLDERAEAIKFILREVDRFEKKGEQLRKKLEQEEPTK
jgi:prefoldin subunit 5